MKFKRSEYLAATTDLISVMGLKGDKGEPLTIGPKSAVEELEQFITDCFKEIDPSADDFAVSTLQVLKSLGYTGFDAPAETTTLTEPGPVVPEEKEWVEKDIKEILCLQIANVRKMVELKEYVTKHADIFAPLVARLDEFQGLDGTRELKTEMQKLVGTPETQMKQPTKAPGGTSHTRVSSDEVRSRREAIEKLIEENRWKSKEIAEKIATQFSKNVNAILTELSDGKNPKYNKFSRVIQSTNGILHF